MSEFNLTLVDKPRQNYSYKFQEILSQNLSGRNIDNHEDTLFRITCALHIGGHEYSPGYPEVFNPSQ